MHDNLSNALASYLAVQEFQVGIALLLGFSCLFLDNRLLLLLSPPLGLVIVPLVVVVFVSIIAGEVRVVTEGFLAVCSKLVQLLVDASHVTYS